MLINYNDGTFGWGVEGSFYYWIPENNNIISHFLKNIYYNEGKYYRIYSQILQLIWVMVLTGVGVASIFDLKRKNDIYVVLKLCIIGITLFELLFEARARYLYLYVPIYILFFILNGNCLEKIKNLLLAKKV